MRANTHEGGGRRRVLTRPATRLASTLVAVIALLAFSAVAGATEIRLSTGNVDPAKGLARGAADPSVTWNYTGDYNDPRFVSYVDNDPAFGGPTSVATCHFVTGNCRTSNNAQYGADVAAGYPAYRGVQFFYLSFDLPGDATGVSLTVNAAGADDRMGLALNGNDIAFWGNVNGTGFGRMDGSNIYAGTSIGAGVEPTRASGVFFENPFAFTPFVLDDPSLFVLGDTNVIRLWTNNTGFRSFTNAARPMGLGDPSVAAFDATLSFEVARVPAPGTLALGLAGLVMLLARGARTRPAV